MGNRIISWVKAAKRILKKTSLYRFLAAKKRLMEKKLKSVPNTVSKRLRTLPMSILLKSMNTPFYPIVTGCFYGSAFRKQLRKRKQMDRALVSIIIPTYQDKYIHKAISSVLEQDRSLADIELLVCVNGPDEDYYHRLTEQYSDRSEIRVLWTPTKNAGAARNLGAENARGDYLFFLDDDDYLTKRYIRFMMAYAQDGVSIVCGPYMSIDEANGEKNIDNYINRAIYHGAYDSNTRFNKSLVVTVTGKLYRKSQYKLFLPMDCSLNNTEDLYFWIQNIGRISGEMVVGKYFGRQFYVRRITSNSLSRPESGKTFSFYVDQRLEMIKRIEAVMFQELPQWQNKLLLSYIISQFSMLCNYYKELPVDSALREKVRIAVEDSPCRFINRSRLASIRGIAFCHNFSPMRDASAYVAAKRLSQVEKEAGAPINWTVVTVGYTGGKPDTTYEQFYAQFQYAERVMIPFEKYFGVTSQAKWAKNAAEAVKDREAEIMYSRSLWIGSHIAALEYRKQHPNIRWYAEFSDPVYLDTNGKPRECAQQEDPDSWLKIEHAVMCQADVLIFTNANQLQFMLANNRLIEDPEIIRKKSLVWHHPALAKPYTKLLDSGVVLDSDHIHIGYFGTFYAKRSSTELLALLQREDVAVHIFTPQKDRNVPDAYAHCSQRIHWHDALDHLEFLNAASRFDYLFLADLDYPGDINPYLPSKLADYLVAGTPILAKVVKGSTLFSMNHPQLTRFQCVDSLLLNSLRKREPMADAYIDCKK